MRLLGPSGTWGSRDPGPGGTAGSFAKGNRGKHGERLFMFHVVGGDTSLRPSPAVGVSGDHGSWASTRGTRSPCVRALVVTCGEPYCACAPGMLGGYLVKEAWGGVQCPAAWEAT